MISGDEGKADRRGISIAWGAEFDYTRVLIRALYLGDPEDLGAKPDEYLAHGSLIGFGQALVVDYGFTDRVFLGARFGLGGILNSDNSTGTRMRITFGPSLTGFVTKNFYLGTDFLFEYLSFDDITPKFGGQVFDGATAHREGEIDGKALLGFSWALKVGGTVPIGEKFALVPELRLHGNAIYFEKDGVDVLVEDEDSFGETDPAIDVYTPGIGIFFGFRRFF